MKGLVRLAVSLLALHAAPRAASAQSTPPPPPATDPAGQAPAPTPDNPAPGPPPPADPGAQPIPAPPAWPAHPPAAVDDAAGAARGAAPRGSAAPPAAKPDATAARGIEWTSLRVLHDKAMLSDAEYLAALKDLGGLVGAGDATTLVVAKLKVTLYGYVEANMTYDSTESCVDFCGNALIQKPRTYRGEHGRTIFGARDARLGFRIAAPVEHGVRVTGLIETDFYGPTTTTEQGLWTNPVLRIRNSYLKFETPVVDILIGQTWSLFGHQPYYLVASVQLPGLPGQTFERTPQLRLSKTLKTSGVTVELAAAANRPPQMDSATPEGVAGIRVLFDKWTGQHTGYMVATIIQPASLAISGDLRRFRIPEFSAAPHTGHVRLGGGVAFDAYLPIVPASKDHKANALSLIGELTIGAGTADMYTALGAAGTTIPAIPTMPPGTYTANFDAGLAGVSATGRVELIKWTSYILGAEFYPGGVGGRLGLIANYGHMESSNTDEFGAGARKRESLYELGAFVDLTRATRVAASGALFDDTYVDGVNAKNYAGMLSAWLFF